MKKLIATLLVIALAAPAFAASVDLAADGSGEVILTVEEGEVVRGVAVEVVVTAGPDIQSVTGTDAIFNVFMDQAFDDESAASGSYALGTGSPVANPAAAGVLELPASAISLSMGVLDETGAQGGAAAGTYTLGIIDLGGDGTVTLAADTTRGGVVGDGLDTEVTYTGGDITGGDTDCYTGPDYDTWVTYGKPDSWCTQTQCHGDADGAEELIGRNYYAVGYDDVDILLAGFGQVYNNDPAAQPWIAADFDHQTELIGRNYYPVGYNDVDILLAWFGTTGVPADCQTASPVSP